MASAREIPPGGEGKIDVKFNTQRRSGINTHRITVQTNDPMNRNVQLELAANLQQLLTASPTRQWFGQIRQEETATRTFTFDGTRLSDVRLSNIRMKDQSTNSSAFSWKLEDTRGSESGELKLNITVNAEIIPPGRFNEIIVVSTNLEEMADFEMFLSGEILGPISANPQRLYFGQFEVGKEAENTITLTANNDKPFKILNASVDDQEFKLDPWKGDSSTEHQLTLKFLPGTPRDRIRTSLVIQTDMDAQREVHIEIHAYQRRTRTDGQQPPPEAGAEIRSGQRSMTTSSKEDADTSATRSITSLDRN